MKLNNKGFAISGIIYAIMLLFITLIFAILGILGTRKIILDKYKKEVADNIENNIVVSNASKIDKSGAPVPKLAKGMIPVIYNGSNWIKAEYKSEYDQNWYNYEQKKWANVVLVSLETRQTYLNATSGYIINDEDILAFYVWIPRYKYKLFNAEANVLCSSIEGLNTIYNPLYSLCYSGNTVDTYIASNYTYGGVEEQEIEIVFEDIFQQKSNGIRNDEYLTHPAFTFGNNELSGIWVGKFETTGNINNLTVLPNSTPITHQELSAMFYASRNMEVNNNIYGLNSNQIDTHMMKNIEWGAATYLTQSRFGRCTNSTCVEMNPNTSTLSSQIANNTSSTTNNYTGIYDMSGGFWEYTMGNMSDISGNFYPSLSNFTDSIESKYYDSYIYDINGTQSRGLLGDATRETMTTYNIDSGGWHGDRTMFLKNTSAWFMRGGYSSDTTDRGIFAYSRLQGAPNSAVSFRLIIINE